jgi:hypothetical protein
MRESHSNSSGKRTICKMKLWREYNAIYTLTIRPVNYIACHGLMASYECNGLLEPKVSGRDCNNA